MYPVSMPPEPSCFDQNCRRKGNAAYQAWLKLDSDKSFDWNNHNYWTLWNYPYRLAKGFHHRCAYSGQKLSVRGEVDHYLDKHKHPHLAYDWDNYRYIAPWVNKKKSRASTRIMDPCELQHGWLQLNVFSGEIFVTDQCPSEERDRLEYTIERLAFNQHPEATDFREERMRWYFQGQVSMSVLESDCPLLADAIKQLSPEDDRALRQSFATFPIQLD